LHVAIRWCVDGKEKKPMNHIKMVMGMLTSSLVCLMPSTLRAADDCTGGGTTVQGTTMPGDSLICQGSCNNTTCPSRDGSDTHGNAIKFCGCSDTDYDTCCTVVLQHNPNGSYTPKKY